MSAASAQCELIDVKKRQLIRGREEKTRSSDDAALRLVFAAPGRKVDSLKVLRD